MEYEATQHRRWLEKYTAARLKMCNVDYYSSTPALFAKLRKATISFALSARPSAWDNSAPIERIFMKFDI
jgi:hypothetical protein